MLFRSQIQQTQVVGLLDLRMPGMDGLTLCWYLKRLHRRMVTMILTAYGASSLVEEVRDAGTRHILPKPIGFPRLLALVEQARSCTNWAAGAAERFTSKQTGGVARQL